MKLQIAEAYVPLWQGGYEHYAFFGGRGGGKSHGVAEALVGLSSKREERIVCGRQFQNSMKDSVKELLENKIYSMNMSALFDITDREIINRSTKSRFSFIGMDRNTSSAKSLEGATIFWGEEASDFNERSIEIIVPTIRAPGSRMVWTWNPRYRTDEVDKMFRGGTPPENSYIRQVNWQDNPYFYLTRMPSEMRRAKKAKPKRFKHIWEGGYDENPEAAVFTNVVKGIVEVPIKIRPYYGMDFGFGSDPNFLVKVYVLEAENEDDEDIIYIAEEAMGYHIPNRDLPNLMRSVTGVDDWDIVADSSRPETIDDLCSHGLNVRGAIKGAGSVKNGINFLTGYKIVVHPDCVNIFEELESYLWATDPMGKPLPMPANNQQDHGIDALRYAVEEHSRTYTNEGDGVDYI